MIISRSSGFGSTRFHNSVDKDIEGAGSASSDP